VGALNAPKSIEVIATSNLNDSERRAAQVSAIPTAGPFAVPAYSVVRVIWPGEISLTK
jgi:hypothetical protein